MKNVFLITADSLRLDYVSYFNPDSPARTPNIDELAANGSAYGSAMANGTHTIISAPTLLTGEYRPAITSETPTLAELMRANGYQTAGFSTNLHIRGPTIGHLELDRGFNTFDMCMGATQEKTRVNAKRVGFEIGRQAKERIGTDSWTYDQLTSLVSYFPQPFSSPVPPAETVNEYIVDWVKTRSSDTPYFLWAFYLDPHEPFLPPEEWIPDKYDGRIQRLKIKGVNRKYRYFKPAVTDPELEMLQDLYVASIEYWDAQIGSLTKTLRSKDDDLTVVITSDHGESLGEHDKIGHPGKPYEELIRVPAIIDGPDIPDRDSEAVVENIDVVRTIAERAGIEVPESVRGVDLLGGESSDRGAVTVAGMDPLILTYRTEDWTFINREGERTLYEVEDGVVETDVSDQYPDRTAEMAETLKARVAHFGETTETETQYKADDEIKHRLEDMGYIE